MKQLPIFLLILGLTTLPSVAQVTTGEKTHVNISINGKRTYMVKNDRVDLEVEMKGDIELNEDETEVMSISRGGFLEIKEKIGGTRHHLLIEGESGGRLSRQYKLNGRRVDFADIDREWYGDILLQIIRETGVDAERRTERILKRSGVAGVLDEVDLIESSSSKSRYLIHLFEQAKLNDDELERAARLGKSIPSSGDKSRFLIASAENFLLSKGMERTYFDIVRGVPSSGDKTRVLIHLADEGLLESRAAYDESIDAAAGIPSSGDRTRFLTKAAHVYLQESPEAYFKAVAGIPSSGDKTRVLLKLVEEDLLDDPVVYEEALAAAKNIPSSGDRTRFLMAAAPMYLPESREAYFEAVNGIPASGDHARTLIKLLEDGELDDASIASLLRSASKIASSGDKARVLIAASDLVADNDDLVDVYLEVVDTIPSSGDQKRALAALLE